RLDIDVVPPRGEGEGGGPVLARLPDGQRLPPPVVAPVARVGADRHLQPLERGLLRPAEARDCDLLVIGLCRDGGAEYYGGRYEPEHEGTPWVSLSPHDRSAAGCNPATHLAPPLTCGYPPPHSSARGG